MRFSVIYSVDVPDDDDSNIFNYAPPDLTLWDETEGDEAYEFSYLGGRWFEGFHAKWVAVLDRDQFDAFIEHTGLKAESTETMGSLGAPGCGFGWAPAISFTGDDEDAIQSAYVTPLPETRKPSGDVGDWERVKAAVLAVYG
jgi:hypothetical protein